MTCAAISAGKPESRKAGCRYVVTVVLDSNVYLSAILFGGVPRVIVQLGTSGLVQISGSLAIRAEVEEVLVRKFGWSKSVASAMLQDVWRHVVEVDPQISLRDCRDPDDNRVLECAVAARAEIIVTGDRHLLELDPYRGMRVLTPRQFLELSD